MGQTVSSRGLEMGVFALARWVSHGSTGRCPCPSVGGRTPNVNCFQADKITKEEAFSRGLLGRAKGKRAYAIATGGSDELITAHRNDTITDAEAEAVSQNAPGNSALQAAGLKALINKIADSHLMNLQCSPPQGWRTARFQSTN